MHTVNIDCSFGCICKTRLTCLGFSVHQSKLKNDFELNMHRLRSLSRTNLLDFKDYPKSKLLLKCLYLSVLTMTVDLFQLCLQRDIYIHQLCNGNWLLFITLSEMTGLKSIPTVYWLVATLVDLMKIRDCMK